MPMVLEWLMRVPRGLALRAVLFQVHYAVYPSLVRYMDRKRNFTVQSNVKVFKRTDLPVFLAPQPFLLQLYRDVPVVPVQPREDRACRFSTQELPNTRGTARSRSRAACE